MTRAAVSLNDLAAGQWVAWFATDEDDPDLNAWEVDYLIELDLEPARWAGVDFAAGHVVILSEPPVETIEVPRAEYEAFVEQLATNGRSPASIVSYVIESGRAMVAATETHAATRADVDRTSAEQAATEQAVQRAVAVAISEQVADAAVDEPAEPAVKGDA